MVKWRILSDPDSAFIPFFCHLHLIYLSKSKLLFSTNASEHLCKYLHLISLQYICLYTYTGNTHSQIHTFPFGFLFVNCVYTYTIKPVFLENSMFSIFYFSNSVKKKAKRMKIRSGKQQVNGIIQMDKWRRQSFCGPCTSDTLLFLTHIRRHVQSSIFSWNPYLSGLNSFRRHLISRCISWHMAKKDIYLRRYRRKNCSFCFWNPPTHYLQRLFFIFCSRSWGYRSEQITYPCESYIVREVTDIEHIDKCLQQYVT